MFRIVISGIRSVFAVNIFLQSRVNFRIFLSLLICVCLNCIRALVLHMAGSHFEIDDVLEQVFTAGSDLEDDFSDDSDDEVFGDDDSPSTAVPSTEISFSEGRPVAEEPCNLSTQLLDAYEVNISTFSPSV